MSDLYFKQLRVGPMQNFSYLVGSLSQRVCVAIDPAWDLNAINKEVEAAEMQVQGVIVTHYHPDHCGGSRWGFSIPGAAEFSAHHHCKVYAHRDEAEGLCQVTGLSRTDLHLCESGDQITVGQTPLTCIHTPGHTPGSQCLLIGDHLMSGDTLFLTGCGRVDLPGGDAEKLFQSLHQRLNVLPDDTLICPGHEYDEKPFAPLAEVRRINPYLQAPDKNSFLHHRGG